MFDNGIIIFNQMLVMFIIVGLGYYLYKRKVFNNNSTKSISGLLTKFAIPSSIIVSFQRDYDIKTANILFLTMISALGIFILSIILANLFYRKHSDRQMSIIFTNNGFMSLPLILAMFGSYGVFLGSAHIACQSIVLWTYGLFILEGKDYRLRLKNIFLNPGVVALLLGVIIFVSPYKLPGNVYSVFNYLANLNTPLAMLVLGCYLAQVELKKLFTDLIVIKASLIRLLLIPVISMLIFIFIPLDLTAKTVLLVGTAAPSAIISAMFAQLYGKDYLFSSRVIALSTILSGITLPLLIILNDFIYL